MSVVTKILVALLTIVSCSAASESSVTASPEAAAMRASTGMPDLCSYPDVCEPCGGAGMPACPPAEDSGALCCSRDGSVCVPWSGGACGGLLGYCANFTSSRDPASGVIEATCHDNQGGSQ